MDDDEIEQIKKKKLAEMMKRARTPENKENEIIELTDANFDEIISSDSPTLVDFWAEWCGPCKFMLPVFSRLAKKYQSIRFARLNVDQVQSVATRIGVYAIPTFIMFKNGQVVDKAVGAVGEPGLHMLAQKYSK
ncbi:MAG: thioredoxin [Marine Group I thaumarchaeote]|nr:MAG: thioredoxin [Marine Group I thaumarchaeote]